MVDVASIIVAAIGLVAGLAGVLVTVYFTWWSDERKRLTESEKLLSKYRDPLLLSCQDLQARFYNIAERKITIDFYQVGEKRENLLLYTAFLVGQYLSWTHILRRQVQFLRFEVDEKNKQLAGLLSGITHIFGSDRPNWGESDGKPCMLSKAQQMAIGEVMTVIDQNDQMFCMGYATFHKQWYKDPGCAPMGGVGGVGEITGTSLPIPSGDYPDGGTAGGDVGNDDANGKADPGITATSHRVQSPGRVGGSQQGDEINRTIEANGAGKHKEDKWNCDFRRWFRPLIEGVAEISKAKDEGGSRIPDQRLRFLQHLLLDLIKLLDEKSVRSEARNTKPCHRAEQCFCSRCESKEACPCERCQASGPGYV